MSVQLRPYQSEMIDSIFEKLSAHDSVLCQSATGSGKTVIMSSFIEKWIKQNPNKKVLVSVHRDELVQQTSLMLARHGILNQTITAKSKSDLFGSVFVGMTQTIYSRKIKMKDVGLMVIDEAHEQIHLKTFQQFPNAKRVAFTATPILNKRITYYECDYCKKRFESREICCYNEHALKWSAPVTMSETYSDIIVGPPIRQLIDEGHLVDEVVFTYDYYAHLEAKGDDDFDENEIAEESVKHDLNVLQEYEEKAKGKKTMIFTASTKQNITLVDTFYEYPIRSYDSVNNDVSDRYRTVEWFRNTEGAILVSTGTFTTGFDERDVECIIVNRPTKSLSLWHQIIGRGARLGDKIYKESFLVIDLGGNVARLGKWSENLDWHKIFTIGLHPAKKKKEVIVQCQKCGYNWLGRESDECEECGHVNTSQRELPLPKSGRDKELEFTESKTVIVSKVPLPNGRKIAEFVRRTSNNRNDYYNILIDKYVDLWKLNGLDSEKFQKHLKMGWLEGKIKTYFKKNYGYSNWFNDAGVPRTYEYLVNKTIERLKKCYHK